MFKRTRSAARHSSSTANEGQGTAPQSRAGGRGGRGNSLTICHQKKLLLLLLLLLLYAETNLVETMNEYKSSEWTNLVVLEGKHQFIRYIL